jgi:two-component system chemotaxis response regulator CheY
MAAKALVLDDSRAMRGILSKILVRIGFDVVQAGDGREGLEVMGRERADIKLILADWNMPVMNGLDFVKALRADPEFASIPIVMVTTETQVEQMMAALTAGATEYIMKPFTPEMVEEKLRLIHVVQ